MKYIFCLYSVLAISGTAFCGLLFEVDFNLNRCYFWDYDDATEIKAAAEPVFAAGDPNVILSGSGGEYAGYYDLPRGAWSTPGFGIIDNGAGLQYSADGNVNLDKGTIELWSDVGLVSSSARLVTVIYDNSNYLRLYASSGGQLRFWMKSGGGDEERVTANLPTWPSGSASGDGKGWNHFLISWDKSSSNPSEQWMAFWVNGERVGYLMGDGSQFGSVSGGKLTFGNDDTFGSAELGANIDAMRVWDITAEEVYEMGSLAGGGGNDFEPLGMAGLEFKSRDSAVTFLATYNNSSMDFTEQCSPEISFGSDEVTLLGNIRPGIDSFLRGAWKTYGIAAYETDTGLHYKMLNNVSKVQGTIEFYTSWNPEYDGEGQFPRVLDAVWAVNDRIRLRGNGNITQASETEFFLGVDFDIDGSSYDKNVYLPKDSFPPGESETLLNHWAYSWKGSSGPGVSDGWFGLWINGVKIGKWSLSKPYFWGNSDAYNTLAFGLSSDGSNRTGGHLDGLRISALPVDEIYSFDVEENFVPPGYDGDEYGDKPSECGEPGTQYPVGDINASGDCVVDFKDFAVFALQWLSE